MLRNGMADQPARERLIADGKIQFAIHHRQGERHTTIEVRRESTNKTAVERVQLDAVTLVNPLGGQTGKKLGGIFVCVDSDSRCCLRCFVQARSIRSADLDP